MVAFDEVNAGAGLKFAIAVDWLNAFFSVKSVEVTMIWDFSAILESLTMVMSWEF